MTTDNRRKDDTRAATTLKWPEACSICAGTGTAFGKTCVCRVGSEVHPELVLPSMPTATASSATTASASGSIQPVAAPEPVAEAVRMAGAKMANTMFNLSQDANMIPLVPLRESMRAMQREWDAAIHSATAAPAQAATDAVLDVLAERRRQVESEGWVPEHDDEHGDGSMSYAAACYALADTPATRAQTVDIQKLWEWTGWSWFNWWKPKDRRRNLVRAAALLLAEIERIDRAALPTSSTDSEKGGEA